MNPYVWAACPYPPSNGSLISPPFTALVDGIGVTYMYLKAQDTGPHSLAETFLKTLMDFQIHLTFAAYVDIQKQLAKLNLEFQKDVVDINDVHHRVAIFKNWLDQYVLKRTNAILVDACVRWTQRPEDIAAGRSLAEWILTPKAAQLEKTMGKMEYITKTEHGTRLSEHERHYQDTCTARLGREVHIKFEYSKRKALDIFPGKQQSLQRLVGTVGDEVPQPLRVGRFSNIRFPLRL